MNVTLTQSLPCSPATFFDLLEGEALAAMELQASSSHREPLENGRRDGVFVRRVRIRPNKELPTVIRTLLGPEGLSYIHEVIVDRPQSEVRWSLDIRGSAGRTDIGGVERVSGTSTSTRVDNDARIHVRLPLVGTRAEQGIHRELVRTWNRRFGFLQDLLARV